MIDQIEAVGAGLGRLGGRTERSLHGVGLGISADQPDGAGERAQVIGEHVLGVALGIDGDEDGAKLIGAEAQLLLQVTDSASVVGQTSGQLV